MRPFVVTQSVIIQFIGLCLFTANPDHGASGFIAILPRVAVASTTTPATTEAAVNPRRTTSAIALTKAPVKSATKTAEPAATGVAARLPGSTTIHPVSHVEPHTALIAFQSSAYVSNVGWKPFTLSQRTHLLSDAPLSTSSEGCDPMTAEFCYVLLNGDEITFDTGAITNPPIKRSLDIGLPHVGKCCTGVSLKSAYLSKPHSGAAAVFNIPTGTIEGVIGACHAGAPPRMDTVLHLNNDGGLTVRATNGTNTKSITLRGNPVVTVENVPWRWVHGDNSDATAPNDAPHYQAYYDMLSGPACSSDQNCMKTTTSRQLCTSKESDNFASVTISHSLNGPPPVTFITDFRCSNTQYP